MLAAGHDPDHLINTYSFEQLALYARAIMGHHARMLNMLIEPVLASQGVEYKSAGMDKKKKSPTTDAQKTAKEAAKLRAMQSSPFNFKTIKTSIDDDT